MEGGAEEGGKIRAHPQVPNEPQGTDAATGQRLWAEGGRSVGRVPVTNMMLCVGG